MTRTTYKGFFAEALAIEGSATPHVLSDLTCFGLLATLTCLASSMLESMCGIALKLEVGWFELAGAAVSLLLLIRTNGGYDRWWEARKLWGAIVNQSRNLVISGLAYGPDDSHWRDRFARLAACFPIVARATLRGEPLPIRVALLAGKETADRIERANHRPSAICLELAHLLDRARREHEMDGWAFAQVDRERAALIDHIGGCERILKTPLPRVYSIKIRRLIAMFLVSLPLVLLHRINAMWLVPLVTMAVAYPLLALDSIGYDLQNPFRAEGFAPLPLEDIELTIERNLLGLLETENLASEPIVIRASAAS